MHTAEMDRIALGRARKAATGGAKSLFSRNYHISLEWEQGSRPGVKAVGFYRIRNLN